MSHPLKIAFWAIVAGQIVLLIAFIGIKENTLRTGTSVLLQTVPVDPLSLLQGEYAVLDYEVAELPIGMERIPIGETIYVRLREGQDVWDSDGYFFDNSDSGRVFLKGKITNRGRLDFGLGTYFIPEGSGHIIERSRDVKVRVAVSSGGTAVIDELLVDGQPFDSNRPPDPTPELPNKAPPPPPAGVPPGEPERKP